VKARPGKTRLYLFLAMSAMMFVKAPISGEIVLGYLYTRTRYGWDGVQYSNYSTFRLTVQVIGTCISNNESNNISEKLLTTSIKYSALSICIIWSGGHP
jgi:hypothetical protein